MILLSAEASNQISANPCHAAGELTPLRVPDFFAGKWPNEPDPCPNSRLKSGISVRAARISPANLAITSFRGVRGLALSVISEPPSFRNITKSIAYLSTPFFQKLVNHLPKQTFEFLPIRPLRNPRLLCVPCVLIQTWKDAESAEKTQRSPRINPEYLLKCQSSKCFLAIDTCSTT